MLGWSKLIQCRIRKRSWVPNMVSEVLGEDCGSLEGKGGSAVWFLDTFCAGQVFEASWLDCLLMLAGRANKFGVGIMFDTNFLANLLHKFVKERWRDL